MWENAPRLFGLYSWLGLCGGYALVMFFNPVRRALGDGFRCLARYKRIWITFALLGFGYFVFQFVTFTPIRDWSDLDLDQIASLPHWYWPRFAEIWKETPLPALEGVAGIFDNATTTYPFSVVAAVFMLLNWRGLHGALVRALRKRYGFWGYLVYLILLLSALASLLKPIVFWQLPEWSGLVPAAGLLRVSATVDAAAFIFEYLLGVYIQVYLITVCLAWTKGVSFEEGELFRFAMRRFSYVLEWAGIVVAVSTLIVRLPLVLAYFTNIPGVLDYLPIARVVMCGLIIVVACVGKFGGSAVAGRITGLRWREAGALGILMNTRGLMELIVLNIGLDLKVISPTLFAMLVIMAVVTTMATTPLLHLLGRGAGLRAATLTEQPSGPTAAARGA